MNLKFLFLCLSFSTSIVICQGQSRNFSIRFADSIHIADDRFVDQSYSHHVEAYNDQKLNVIHYANFRGFYLMKTDANDRLIAAKRFFFGVNRTLQINEVLVANAHFYLLGAVSNQMYLAKVDTSLNLVWSRQFGQGNNTVLADEIVFDQGFLYVSASADQYSVITKLSDNGQVVNSLRINDGNAFIEKLSAPIFYDEYIPTTQIAKTANRLYFSSINPGFKNFMQNVSDTLHFLTFDDSLNLINSQSFKLDSGDDYSRLMDIKIMNAAPVCYYYEIVKDVDFAENRLFFSNQGLLQSRELRHITDPITTTHSDESHFKNEIDFANHQLSVFDHDDFGVGARRNKGAWILTEDSTQAIISANFVQMDASRNWLGEEVIGISEHLRGLSLYSVFLVDTAGSDNYLQIIQLDSALLPTSCELFFNAGIVQLTPNPITTYSNYVTINPTGILGGNLSLNNTFLSLNQFQYCGPAFDTCSNLYARIQNPRDTICQSTSLQFTSLAFEAQHFEWYVDGQLLDSADLFTYQFDSARTYLVALRVLNSNQTCDAWDSVSITVLAKPGDMILPLDTTICAGDSFQILASGAINYSWSPTFALSCNTCPNPIISVADTTKFVLTGSNAIGCVNRDTFDVFTHAKPIISVLGPQSVCLGASNVNYTFASPDSASVVWSVQSPGIISQNFGDSISVNWPSVAGQFNVTAFPTSNKGCEGDSTALQVNITSGLISVIQAINDSICYDTATVISLSTPASVQSNAFVWQLSNAKIVTGDSTGKITIKPDSLGPVLIIVEEFAFTNTDTCYGTDTLTLILIPKPVKPLLSGPANICLDAMDTFQVLNPLPAGNSFWLATGASDSLVLNSNLLSTSWNSTGNYSVSFANATPNGCLSDTSIIEVNVRPIPETSTLNSYPLICNVLSDTASYLVSGLDSSTYFWNILGGEIVSGQTTNLLRAVWTTGSINANLSVTETSQYGCQGDSLIIPQPFDFSRLDLKVLSVDESNYITLAYELINESTNPSDSINILRKVGDGPWELRWTVGKNQQQYVDRLSNATSGFYFYQMSTSNACQNPIDSDIHKNIWLRGQSDVGDSLVQLEWNTYQNWANDEVTYQVFDLDENLDNALYDISDTTLVFEPQQLKKTYCFRIKAVNEARGLESWSQSICINFKRPIQMPNVITPNGDGYNDRLEIVNLEAYNTHHLEIYNRWGRAVYSTENYQNSWPESIPSKGTYFYMLKVTEESGNPTHYRGWVEVLY